MRKLLLLRSRTRPIRPSASVELETIDDAPIHADPLQLCCPSAAVIESTWGSNITALARNVWGRRSWRPHHTTPASFDILKLRIIRAERRLPPRIEVPFQGFELPIPHLQSRLAE